MADPRPRDARSGHARLVPRRDRPAVRPAPLTDPRTVPAAPARPATDPRQARTARVAALVLAATGLVWIAATWAGSTWGWGARTRAFFDLFALGGFGFGLYLTWQAWRIGRARGA